MSKEKQPTVWIILAIHEGSEKKIIEYQALSPSHCQELLLSIDRELTRRGFGTGRSTKFENGDVIFRKESDRAMIKTEVR